MTNMKADLMAVVKALMFESVKYGFTATEGTIKPDALQPNFYLKIQEVLPDSMIRNITPLLDGKYIEVAPLPSNITLFIENHDFVKLFKPEHLQRIYRRDLSAAYNTPESKDNHPLCELLKVDIPFRTENLTGLSETCNIAVQEVATSTANIWNTNIFHYALSRPLLLYFRGALAARREKRYKDMVERKSKEVEEKKQKRRVNISRQANWQRIRSEKKNVDKCRDRIQHADSIESQMKWEERLEKSVKRLEGLIPSKAEKADNPTDMTGIEYENYDEAETVITSYLEKGLSEEVVADLILDGQEEEDSQKECSAKKIKQLVAFSKAQLWNTRSFEDLQQNINDNWTGEDQLSAEEEDSIINIWSLLGPFMPTKEGMDAIALQLPIVIISNIVQQVAGYSEFSREICPTVSPSKIHALPLSAATIFEIMASNAVQENFILFDANRRPIASREWATAQKRATLAAFSWM